MTNQTDQGVTIDVDRLAQALWNKYADNDATKNAIAIIKWLDAQPAPPVPGVEPNSNESIPDVIGRALFDWLKELIDAGEWNPTLGELDAIIQHLTDKVSVFVWEREQ